MTSPAPIARLRTEAEPIPTKAAIPPTILVNDPASDIPAKAVSLINLPANKASIKEFKLNINTPKILGIDNLNISLIRLP